MNSGKKKIFSIKAWIFGKIKKSLFFTKVHRRQTDGRADSDDWLALNARMGSTDWLFDLDADGLKSLYKDILKDEVPEGSKGAGVGFVDIAFVARGNDGG